MPRPPLEVRPDLEGLAPYVSPQAPARYRMNTNESPYPPPRALVSEVTDELERIALNRYPDRDARRLFEAIESHVNWPREGLWIANGSNEVFLHLFLAFGGPDRSALTFEPTYSLHSMIPRIAATPVHQVPRNERFLVDPSIALRTIEEHRPDVVILCSPNNPSAGIEPRATVEALLEAAPGVVVVDEAYVEFAPAGSSVTPLLDRYDNLVVTRTFSKAWQLAGVRIGYLMAAPALVAEMARVRLPYHLSTITQVVGEAAVRHAPETMRIVAEIVTERDRIVAGLEERGVEVFPSAANFVLFRVPDAGRVWKALLERDVLVRDYSSAPGLEDCLRVTAGTPEETDAFLAGLKGALDA